MAFWIQVTLQVCLICVVAHLFGYLMPTLTFLYCLGTVSGKVLLYLTAVIIGLLLSFKSEPYIINPFRREPNEAIIARTKEKLTDLKSSPKKMKDTQPLVSRNVDDLVDELISLLFRDYISPWYSWLVQHPSLFCKELREPIRQMLFNFQNRCRQMDDVELFTNDFVIIITHHLQHIKGAIINPAEKISSPYKVYKFLKDSESELDHLRLLTEFLLLTVLPSEYVQNKQLCSLLREVFAVSVFYPAIDKFCDPDFINLKLISYLKQQQIQAERHRRTYAYAETYEDFIKMIQECASLEDLQRMRYYIATEIMQSTTMSNLKRSKGMDVDKEFIPQKTNKGDLLQARNLSRYLNQLRFARGLCEKRLKAIGGPDYVSSSKVANDNLNKNVFMPGQKVLSMSVIMQSSFCRRYFSKFLQKEEVHSLLGFWEAVEEMKYSDKELWHKLGNDVVQIYVHNPSSCVKLNKNTLKGIEGFMMANKGPEAFFQAQDEVYKSLESSYYAPFIVSDIYHKMLADVDKQGIDFMQESQEAQEIEVLDDEEEGKGPTSSSEVSVFDHSSYARSQLKVLTEKLSDKKQAFEALKRNPKCEKKLSTKLETEIENLIKEQNMLENHIEKTELWIEYLGIWQATIMEAMEKRENDKVVPYFVIRVHLANDAESIPNKMAGWVVSRSLSSFHGLHQKLVPAASWLKKIDLPTKPIFKSFDRNYLEKAKHALQTFLSAVTKDDGLNKSEALYDFLSPSPEYMKHPPASVKKPIKFNIMQLFKSVQNTLSQFDESEEDALLFLDDADSKEDKKDSIAEPLYTMINEIFELKGVFNLFRRSLIMFVQISYGQTINRQLREMVSWILSEPMLLFYLQLFRDSMWPPTGQTTSPVEERTLEQRRQAKLMAKQIFLNNTPELLSNLIGQQNAKRGLSKVLDALQNKNFNKQLFYKLLEAFLYKYAPELKKQRSEKREKSD